ncbi:hypothetical protein PHMEG_00022965 [Phytophthora megakarya]|uniref:Uncharacterized protein n=1 Tax=Phytophthora megakarya TaxID=4795 RepID=A0A225VHG7_9STRA|nr:hypothetical protein PHMEG_00022965 [Phytophthora megakarya]
MDLLRCIVADDATSHISPTGIPPYIHLYRQHQETQRVIERMSRVLLSNFSKLLEDKCVGSGVMRKEELHATIRELPKQDYIITPPDTPAGSFFGGSEIASSTVYQSLLSFLTWTPSGGLATKRWNILRLKDCRHPILAREIIKSDIRSGQNLSNIFVTLWSQPQVHP